MLVTGNPRGEVAGLTLWQTSSRHFMYQLTDNQYIALRKLDERLVSVQGNLGDCAHHSGHARSSRAMS